MRRAIVHERGGAQGTTLTVSCPVRSQCVSLSVCAACPRAEHLPDGTEADGAVECRHPPQPGRKEAARAMLNMDLGEAAVRVTVGEVARQTVVMVRDDAALDDVRAAVDAARPAALPVVTLDGALVGLVSHVELRGANGAAEVRAVMVRDVEPLGEEQPVVVAIVRMASGEGTLPVIAADGHVTGVISSLDVMRWMAGGLGYEV